jgi:predicted O-methyltransferase YrrM
MELEILYPRLAVGGVIIIDDFGHWQGARKAPPPDLAPAFLEIYAKCAPHSMTSIERMYGLYSAVNYLVDQKVPGDFVECGVWQGGSAMMMAHALGIRQTERRIWLYDTFAGMTAPTDADRDFAGHGAMGKRQDNQSDHGNEWRRAGIEVERRNMPTTAKSESAVRLVEGPVESTLLGEVPGTIALLRLDTDWYESTKMELEILYPRLAVGGVIIIDDYGHWQGARKAVDEYFAKPGVAAPLLNRMDYTGRIGVRTI